MNHTTIDTPVGELIVVVDAAGTVHAAGWEPLGELVARVLPGTDPADLAPVDDVPGVTDATWRYFAGDVRALDAVRVAQDGAPFTTRAWEELRRIEPGAPVSYTELAGAAGNAGAIRAAGAACAGNGVAPFVPCHRVLRSDGSLGGYRFGLATKRWLLDHEARNRYGTGEHVADGGKPDLPRSA